MPQPSIIEQRREQAFPGAQVLATLDAWLAASDEEAARAKEAARA